MTNRRAGADGKATSAEQRARDLGIDLAATAAPVANYVPSVRTGNLVFLSGQLPTLPDGTRLTGKVGHDVSMEQGYAAARLATSGLLARLHTDLGSLDKVKRIVKLTGFVHTTPDFGQEPAVVNGASDLLVEVFGEAGRHARAAIGVVSLPFGAPVEVEMVVEVED